jgi:hypothetical protein
MDVEVILSLHYSVTFILNFVFKEFLIFISGCQ